MNASGETILATKKCSANAPSLDRVEITEYTGLVSGKKLDKAGLLDVFYGQIKSAAQTKNCSIVME